jgi:hypothetical protein
VNSVFNSITKLEGVRNANISIKYRTDNVRAKPLLVFPLVL